jgi:hypothetical protein
MADDDHRLSAEETFLDCIQLGPDNRGGIRIGITARVAVVARSRCANQSADASAHGALGNVAAVEAHTRYISRKSH